MSDTATVERDLAAVEAALLSGSAGHADAEARRLQELALELRAAAPGPPAELAERLGRQVERGFAGVPRSARPRRARPRWLAPVLGAGVPLAAVLALLVVSGGGGAGVDDASVSSGGGGTEQVSPAAPQADARGFAPGQPQRRIERSFSLELGVPADELTRVAGQVTEVTDRHGGFVLSSSVDSGEDDGAGRFSLRIPAHRLRPALHDLSSLATLISQSEEGRDVTRRHVTAKDRLQAARAERNSLLRRLEAAATDEEAEAIRRRLDIVAAEIGGWRAQLRDLRLRTNYAVVDVSLEVRDRDDGAGVGGSLDDALDDAGDLLVGFAGVLIRVLALAVPLALLGGAGWAVTSPLRRRRRESALA